MNCIVAYNISTCSSAAYKIAAYCIAAYSRAAHNNIIAYIITAGSRAA